MTNEPMNYFVTTADGSKTIYNPVVGENYHSRNGALQESQHVFLNSGLRYFLGLTPALSKGEEFKPIDEVSVLEIGFGTGLNFLLSADFCTMREIKLDYVGIEAYPLSTEMITQTGYDQYVSPGLWGGFTGTYPAAMQNTVGLNGYVNLHVAPIPLLEFATDKQFDVIYFDAFASANQPEMWSEKSIKNTVRYLKLGGVFVTYAITGNLKRMLKALGCKIEKVPGALGKREMLRATLLVH